MSWNGLIRMSTLPPKNGKGSGLIPPPKMAALCQEVAFDLSEVHRNPGVPDRPQSGFAQGRATPLVSSTPNSGHSAERLKLWVYYLNGPGSIDRLAAWR